MKVDHHITMIMQNWNNHVEVSTCCIIWLLCAWCEMVLFYPLHEMQILRVLTTSFVFWRILVVSRIHVWSRYHVWCSWNIGHGHCSRCLVTLNQQPRHWNLASRLTRLEGEVCRKKTPSSFQLPASFSCGMGMVSHLFIWWMVTFPDWNDKGF